MSKTKSLKDKPMSTNQEFRIINIVPLIGTYKNEIIADILYLHRECGVSDVAFMMPLGPEEQNPTMEKAMHLCELFLSMRELLIGFELRVGILIQSTMGHGAVSKSGFKRRVNAKGTTTASMCPLDPGFKEYIRKSVEIVASTKPDFLIVDDDFRLANYGASGCYCELHLDALEKATGRKFECEELLKELENDKSLRKQWDDVRLESLIALAREIRAGIDSTDPSLPCGFCICDAGGMELHFAHKIVETLAGGTPQFVRINTAWYYNSDPKSLLSIIYWTSAQTKIMKDIPEILAESDTFMHNRYYTSAKSLNTQIVFSILHGCTGLKLWVSRTHEFQPESGEAYRKIIKDNIAAYRKLRGLVSYVTWDGPTTPLPQEVSEIPAHGSPARNGNWTYAVLSRMGIPSTVGSNPQAHVTMLSGPECDLFSDAEIKEFLTKGLLLDGQAAIKLCKRGMGDFIGVDADSPECWNCSFEQMNGNLINGIANGKRIAIASLVSGSAARLIPNSQKAQTLSTLYWIPFYMSRNETEVGAGLVLYENKLGGRVAVYASTIGSTPFMDENRREQLINVLGWLNCMHLPIVAVSDIEIYAMHGTIDKKAGGGELLALFNLNMDSLDKLRLRFGTASVSSIEKLGNNGNWRHLKWRNVSSSDIIVETQLNSIVPLILRIQRKPPTNP